MNVKTLTVLALIVSWVHCLEIVTPGQIKLKRQYILSTYGANGPVKYKYQNLPAGVNSYQNFLYIENKLNLTQGYYFILVRATDSTGKFDQKIIVIVIPDITQTENFSIQDLISKSDNQKIQKQNNLSSSLKNQSQYAISSSLVLQNQTGKYIANSNQNGIQSAQSTQRQSANRVPVSQSILAENNQKIETAQLSGNLKGEQISSPSSVFQAYKASFDSKSSSPNFTPDLIKSNQAPTSNLKVRKPSQQQLDATGAFQRQMRAQRAVANLLYLVMNSTANKNAALSQVAYRQQLYKNATDSLFEQNQSLLKLQNSQKTVSQSLKSSTQSLLNIKLKSQETKKQQQLITNQKNRLSIQLQTNKNLLDIDEKQIQRLQIRYGQLVSEKDSKTKECKNLQNQISRMYDMKDQRLAGMYGVKIKLAPARKEVQNNLEYLEQVKAELAKAQQRVEDARSFVVQLEAEEKKFDDYIKGIDNNIQTSQPKLKKCKSTLQQITASIQRLDEKQLPELSQNKTQKQSIISQKSQRLAQLTKSSQAFRQQFLPQIQLLERAIKSFQQQLASIQLQMVKIQYNISDSQERVKQAKYDLDNANKKLNEEQAKIYDYTRKLEQARVEKQDADLKVNQILLKNVQVSVSAPNKSAVVVVAETSNDSDMLNKLGDEFSIKNTFKPDTSSTNTSNTSSITNNKTNTSQTAKILYGKNISEQLSSLLRQGGINYIQPNNDGSYTIKNTPEFINYFFGPKIQPPNLKTTILYSPKIKMLQANNQSSFSVVSTGQISFSGGVYNVTQDSFGLISQQGNYYQVYPSDNTKILTTINNLENIQFPMNAIVRGDLIGSKQISARLIFIYRL